MNPVNIIAIGASAGGLEAIQDFLSHFPNLENTSIIIAQHLSPTHKSMLVQLLSRQTSWNVEEAHDGETIQPRMVYITPPDKDITVDYDRIFLRKPSQPVGPKPSVDVLFQSLKKLDGRVLIGIIMSGTGSDGSMGLHALKKEGGIILVQSPESAKYDGMPQAAISTGLVDLILPPSKMGDEIHYILENNGKIRESQEIYIEHPPTTMSKVFSLLGKRTGTDFSNYKPATIQRRLTKRLNTLGIHSLEEYLAYIEKNPAEIDEMFKTILIGVTKFFRDEDAFHALQFILEDIIARKKKTDQIRIWVPGCSTGEEAYSIAILIYKILQKNGDVYPVQIFATDIDEQAIAIARKGIYSHESLEHIPQEIQEEFFIRKGSQFELVKNIRSMVLFSKHDVIQNPPFLKLDLISCRNLLIYFNLSLQQQIIPIFHYALNNNGYLFLGKSETIGQFTDLFNTIDQKNKIYQKKKAESIHPIRLSGFKTAFDLKVSKADSLERETIEEAKTIPSLVKDTLYETFEYPYVIVDENYNIQEVYGDVRLFLGLAQGTIQVNILKMINPELQIELRSLLTKAVKEKISIKSQIKKIEIFEKVYYVRFSVKPLLHSPPNRNLFMIIFENLDIEPYIEKAEKISNDELINLKIQELEQELAATKEHLQTYIEELETSNEELQSLNEELQSTNEELQSSIEELETSNEELQSTNEEIQIAYAELKITHEELERKEKEIIENQANLNALLNNNQQAFILIDSSYRIITFNNKAFEVFRKLGKSELAIGNTLIDYIPPGQLEAFLYSFNQATQGKSSEMEMTITYNDGQVKHFILNFSPVIGENQSIHQVTIGLIDITELRKAIYEVNFKERLLSSLFHTIPVGICITDSEGKFFDVNQVYCDIYGYKKEELIGKHFTIVVPDKDKEYLKNLHDRFIESGEELPKFFQVVRKDGKIFTISVKANLLIQPDGSRFKVTSLVEVYNDSAAIM